MVTDTHSISSTPHPASDVVYHRTNFTLGGAPGPVADTALRVIEEALNSLVCAPCVGLLPTMAEKA